MTIGRLRERLSNSEWIPLLLGGFAGAVWMLLITGNVAHADNCLSYVEKVKNFVSIPKELLEDCMRTATVQAAITAALGSMGGGAIAIQISNALAGMKEPGTPATDTSSEPPHCGFCGAEMAPGSSICPKCKKAKQACRNCGKKIWSAEADPLCPSCKMAGAEDKPAEKEAEHCGWCGAEMPRGATICPKCNKGKEVCRNCGKKIWSAEADPLCPACKMAGEKDKPAEKEAEHCGWCGADMPPGGSICPKCNKGKEVCRSCGKKIWSAEPNPLCPSCKMKEAKDDRPEEKEAQHCGWCGAEMATGANICPKCNKSKEICRNCGKRIWSAEPNPICPTCMMTATKQSTPPKPSSQGSDDSNHTDDDDNTNDTDDTYPEQ